MLHRFYKHGFAAYGSVRNLAKQLNSPVEVRKFLYSKSSYFRFTLATRNFKRMRAFARFKNKIWCMDLAYVDELPKDINGVKYLLVRHVLFGRTVDAKGMKTKDAKETVKTFSKLIQKRVDRKFWVARGTEFAGDLKKFCKAEGINVYSTVSDE